MTDKQSERAKRFPLETMLMTMQGFDDEAEGFYAKLNELIESGGPAKNAPSKEHQGFMNSVTEIRGKLRKCRLNAQRCAVAAAPYMHSKRAGITIGASSRYSSKNE